MRSALILAGHGSHISPNNGGLVWRHVDHLRARGVADEITAAFWKEKPSFATVLNSLTARDVTIIPLFTAHGFFTQSVIPTEMGLTGGLTVRGNRIIRYTPPLHEHPYLARVVRARVLSARRDFGLPADQTAVAIIGHSTVRNPESRKATETQAARLRAEGINASAVYLEDTPRIAEIYGMSDAQKLPNLIAVPYFLAAGSHTTIDVPLALGLEPGATAGLVQGRRVFYTAPVGVDDDLRDVILTLAKEAGAPLNLSDGGGVGVDGDRFPSAGREELLAAVAAAGVLRFGGLRLSTDEVRPWDDDGREVITQITHLAALRQRVREEPFRSLATADDLPRGWRIDAGRPERLHAIVETIYPGAVAEWAAARNSTLHVNSLPVTARRQVGMFRPLETLSNEDRSSLVGQVCADCVGEPLWHKAGASPKPNKLGRLACPEPCNHWLSAALPLCNTAIPPHKR